MTTLSQWVLMTCCKCLRRFDDVVIIDQFREEHLKALCPVCIAIAARIERDKAEYFIDPETQEREWRWKECK